MRGQRLDFDPGERFAYSNYGYCLLGRVIEKLTKQPYDAYVKEKVLAPLQITTMDIGGSHLEDRLPQEVRYYDPGISNLVSEANRGKKRAAAYGACKLDVLDSHGGWIASAVDLVRFASAFDDPDKCTILKPELIKAMYTPPPIKFGETYYALGWFVRPKGERKTTWHTGSLPGTSTFLMRRYDGLNVAVLFNSRVSPTGRALDPRTRGPIASGPRCGSRLARKGSFFRFPIERVGLHGHTTRHDPSPSRVGAYSVSRQRSRRLHRVSERSGNLSRPIAIPVPLHQR